MPTVLYSSQAEAYEAGYATDEVEESCRLEGWVRTPDKRWRAVGDRVRKKRRPNLPKPTPHHDDSRHSDGDDGADDGEEAGAMQAAMEAAAEVEERSEGEMEWDSEGELEQGEGGRVKGDGDQEEEADRQDQEEDDEGGDDELLFTPAEIAEGEADQLGQELNARLDECLEGQPDLDDSSSSFNSANAAEVPHPPPRQLPPDILVHVKMFLAFVQHELSRSAWEAMRIAAAIFNRESLSWFQINHLMEKLAMLQEEQIEVCAQCHIRFTSEACRDLDHCPHDGQPRWRPLDAKEKKKKNPPVHGRPVCTIPYWPVKQFVHAIYASPSAIEETLKWGQQATTILALPQNERPTLSTGLADSPHVLKLRENKILLNELSTALIYSSDGAVLRQDKGKKPVNGEFHIVRRASASLKTQFQHSWIWRSKTIGPRKASHVDSNNFEFEEEVEELERPFWVWNAKEGKAARTNVVVVLDSSDTVASCAKCKGRGALGKQACFYCHLEGEYIDSNYVPCCMRPHGSTGSDVLLDGMEAGEGQEVEALKMRSWEQASEDLETLDALGPETKEGKDWMRDRGISGYPIFSATDSHRLGYPFYWSLGHMHFLYNMINHVLDLLTGIVSSAAQPPPISPDALEAMGKLHAHTRHLSPTALGQSIGPPKHRGSFKSTEVIRLLDELPHLTANIGLSKEWREYILLFTKVMRMIGAANIERADDGGDINEFDCTALRPDGLDVAPLFILRTLIPKFVVETEHLFYGRDRAYLLKVLNITLHRTLHWPTFLEMLGPSYSYAEYGMEGVIGDDKCHMSSPRHPLSSIHNHQRRINIAIKLRLFYDIGDPALVARAKPRKTHPLIDGLALLHPHEVPTKLLAANDEVELIQKWCKEEKVRLVEGAWIERSARCDLGLKGEVLRSVWGEKKGTLEEEDEAMGQGEFCDGSEEYKVARFAKVTPVLSTLL
ncbi:hypothetical protein JCM1841_005647 [Sporobolomyces salmonicolor]